MRRCAIDSIKCSVDHFSHARRHASVNQDGYARRHADIDIFQMLKIFPLMIIQQQAKCGMRAGAMRYHGALEFSISAHLISLTDRSTEGK